ncbi:MAG: CYTH domain-containing protein [Candidatus Berkelbacteria bacterium]|nr:CYTH domain-containing protein [Candidatus Berkelbacteria bacterium]
MSGVRFTPSARMKNIEVEFRSQIDKTTYDRVLKFLLKHGKNLGADDKRVWFFVMPDRLLKVTDNITKETGKITLKLTKIGHGHSFEEIEFPIAEADIEKAIKLFEELGHEYLVEPIILRHDFEYKGVEVAVKYSKTWGYHLEFEVMVSSKDEESRAESLIREVASDIGVEIMNNDELKSFTQNVEETYVNPVNMPKVR